MIIKQTELETVCGVTSALPQLSAPSFAFAGKSNVGKSSLINALMNRKALARVSNKPGKTQTINFYKVTIKDAVAAANGAQGRAAEKAMYFVDLPGYGYAKRSKEEVAKWGPMVERYLATAQDLRYLFLLIDIRHLPSENDEMMLSYLRETGHRVAVIATKADKLNKTELSRQVPLLREALRLSGEELLLPWSAQTKQGREELYALMEREL